MNLRVSLRKKNDFSSFLTKQSETAKRKENKKAGNFYNEMKKSFPINPNLLWSSGEKLFSRNTVQVLFFLQISLYYARR